MWKNTSLWSALRPFSGSTAAWKTAIVLAIAVVLNTHALRAAEPTGLDQAGHLQVVKDSHATSGGFSWTKLAGGIQLQVHGLVKNVLFYGPEIVRVNASPGKPLTTQPSIVVVTPSAAVPFDVQDSPATLTLVSQKLRITVDKKTGALAFAKSDGTPITRESSDIPTEVKPVTVAGATTYEAKQTFILTPDESLYGLGQYNDRYMDYRGQKVKLVQTNIGIVVPLLISTKRYGIMPDIYSKMLFEDGTSGASFWAESAPAGMDYYFMAADDMDGVIAAYRQLTGPAPMYPKAAFGLFMSKERYKTQNQLIDVARTFRKEGFPLDYIVQDWQYWGGAKDGTWSGMIWDKERYPDPAALTKTLHDELHTKLMISIWPSVGNDTELAHELDAKGLRFEPLHWISKHARIYDAYSDEGRAIYYKYVKKGLLDVGVDALWMDGTEVEISGACHDPNQVEQDIKGLGQTGMGPAVNYLNTYSLETTRGVYEGQRADGEKRVFTLTRSAYTGQQRYAALPWSGDTESGWKTFENQIAGGLNVCMAGLPYYTQDTGGFFVHNFPGGEKNEEWQELYARWNQFGIFNPIYRIHGTNVEREPYVFKTLAPKIYKSLLAAANLRYKLLPYIYSLAWQSTANGYTMMRGLPMDFPDDLNVRRTDDAFMFGPAFLVHPVTRAMYHLSSAPPPVIPAEVLTTPDGQPGLAVQYFEGTDFQKPAGKTIETKLEHTWPGPPLADPPPGLSGFDNFSARWEGMITAPEDGEYEIGMEFDDGARLYLDNKLILNDWGFGQKRYKGIKVQFTKGQKISVKVEYHQGTLDRYFRLGWRTPSDFRALADMKQQLNNTMETYLPPAAGWYDFWTNTRFDGGQTVKKDCPLDLFPLYVRAGSIVPIGPVLQYATEKPDAAYEIRIYPGADAKFTIYEDDNETYRYEKGERATYDLAWNDATKTLNIGARQGSFPGMVARRKLNIVLASPGKNVGMEESHADVKTIQYNGQAIDVRLDQ
jgi:alpha-D-xyloside xylohydrolase